MTIKKLIAELSKFELTANVVISSDEELNTIYNDFEVAVLGEDDDTTTTQKVVIYGLSGSESEDSF